MTKNQFHNSLNYRFVTRLDKLDLFDLYLALIEAAEGIMKLIQ